MGEETREDLNRYQLNKKCSCKYVILFIAFSIVLLTDFLLPIFTDADDKTDYTKSAEEKTEPIASTVELIFSVIAAYPFSIIVSSYTIIMIYSDMRKEYIKDSIWRFFIL